MRRLLVCWLTFLIAVILSLPAMADKRVALVIGNGKYGYVTPLDNRQTTRGFLPKHCSRSALP